MASTNYKPRGPLPRETLLDSEKLLDDPELSKAKPTKFGLDSTQVTPLPLVLKGVYSLVSDMKLGWKPQNEKKANYLFEVPPVIAFKYNEQEPPLMT